jgi:hypothetical protein
MLISYAADMGLHFANTTNFEFRKAAIPSSGPDRRTDRIKSNANSEITTRATAVRLQGGVRIFVST